jgi:glycosyltransferase involved in cell wall biosynthesis
LLEAMSHGLPSVSFDCKVGPSDLIEDGKNGLLVPSGNAVEFSEAMKKLAGKKTLRKKLSSESIKLCKKYNINYISERWVDLFKKIAAKDV